MHTCIAIHVKYIGLGLVVLVYIYPVHVSTVFKTIIGHAGTCTAKQ